MWTSQQQEHRSNRVHVLRALGESDLLYNCSVQKSTYVGVKHKQCSDLNMGEIDRKCHFHLIFSVRRLLWYFCNYLKTKTFSRIPVLYTRLLHVKDVQLLLSKRVFLMDKLTMMVKLKTKLHAHFVALNLFINIICSLSQWGQQGFISKQRRSVDCLKLPFCSKFINFINIFFKDLAYIYYDKCF